MSIKATESKRVRGWVMRLLEKSYPEGVELSDLAAGLITVCEVERGALPSYVAYLEEKGYVTTNTATVFGERVTIAKLTAKGKDLLEQSILPDPGVSVGVIG